MLDAYAWLALAPVAGLAAYCLSQVAALRLIKGCTPYYSLFLGFGTGLLALAAVSAVSLWRWRRPPPTSWDSR